MVLLHAVTHTGIDVLSVLVACEDHLNLLYPVNIQGNTWPKRPRGKINGKAYRWLLGLVILFKEDVGNTMLQTLSVT